MGNPNVVNPRRGWLCDRVEEVCKSEPAKLFVEYSVRFSCRNAQACELEAFGDKYSPDVENHDGKPEGRIINT